MNSPTSVCSVGRMATRIFSVSKSQVPDVIRYIENQREHHKSQTFEEEYISLLKLHGIELRRAFCF
jgi:hypothetical protein